MPAKFSNLDQCETYLSNEVENVNLLGEIPLSIDDIESLTNLINQTIADNISRGTRMLKTKAPTCLAVFLVVMGRFYDKDVGYWPIVEKKVGKITPNWQRKWGKLFLEVLDQRNLPIFEEDEGLAYVTPILVHTCIPDNCLEEYFERVLLPLIERDLSDPYDRTEIKHDLLTKRTFNQNRLEMDARICSHREEVEALRDKEKAYRFKLKKFKEVFLLLVDEEDCEKKRKDLDGLENIDSSRASLLERLNDIGKIVKKLINEADTYRREIEKLKKEYQPILEYETKIKEFIMNHNKLKENKKNVKNNQKQIYEKLKSDWRLISIEPWNDNFIEVVLRISLQNFSILIEQYQNLLKKQRKCTEKINDNQKLKQKERQPTGNITKILTTFFSIIFWFYRRKPARKSNGDQETIEELKEIELALQEKRGSIRELLSGLSLKEELINKPNNDLYINIESLHKQLGQITEFQIQLSNLEKEHIGLIKQIQQVSSQINVQFTGDVNTWHREVSQLMEEANIKKETTRDLEFYIENEVLPDLKENKLEYKDLYSKLKNIDSQLEELGDGSVENGLKKIREFHKFRERVLKNRQLLNSKYQDLKNVEENLNKLGWEKIKDTLKNAVDETIEQSKSINNTIKRLENEIKKFPPQYFGIDEPIRRFLLYGGETAERYLSDSVMLLAKSKSQKEIEDVHTINLPDRIVQSLEEWLDFYKAKTDTMHDMEEESDLKTYERFRAPQLFFDMLTGEISAYLPTQRFTRIEKENKVEIVLNVNDAENHIYSKKLNLYKRSKELVETPSIRDIYLNIPAEKYIFSLKGKDRLIHQWEVKGLRENGSYLAFHANSHKLIKGDYLPKTQLIIVANSKIRINPQNCILSYCDSLFGGWKDYSWYEVDLSSLEEFSLAGEDDFQISIPLMSEDITEICLLGGIQSPGIYSIDRHVYNLMPKFIRYPFKDQDKLHLIKLSVLSDEENKKRLSKHYQMDELIKSLIDNKQYGFDIPIGIEQLLGDNTVGCYKIRIYKPPYLDWKQSICIIPEISVSFDQALYPPYVEEPLSVLANLSLPKDTTFKPDKPAQLVSNDKQAWQMKTISSEDKISGIIRYSMDDDQSFQIPVSMEIPKLRWRIQGLEDTKYDQWFDKVEEELWIGEWEKAEALFLIIETPKEYDSEVVLELKENNIKTNLGRVHNQKVKVDLKAMEDKLHKGPSLETFTIILDNKDEYNSYIKLFTVRTRWEANIERCYHYPEEKPTYLYVFWKEKGIADQKIIRVWRLSKNQPQLIREQVLSRYEYEAVLKFEKKELQPGSYRIHIEPYDPWTSKRYCPNKESPSTVDYEISQAKQKEVVQLSTVWTDEKHQYPLGKNFYKIRVIGKVSDWKLPEKMTDKEYENVLVVPYNEGWYVGILEVVGVPLVIEKLHDTNPVKFETSPKTGILTTIEDRHGDGAMYCYICNILFWDQETNVNHEHKTYGPIERFDFEWVSDE